VMAKPKKSKKKLNKRRNPYAYEMVLMKGNGEHKDKRKESFRKACRGRPKADD